MASRLLTRASRGHNALKVHSSSRSNLSGLLCVRTLTSTTNGQQRKKPKQKKPQSGPRASEADFEQAYHNDPTYIALHKSQNPSTRVGWNFSDRHIGPRDADIQSMLKAVGPTIKSMDDFISQVIPQDIMSTFSPEYLETYPATSELSTKFHFRDIMGENDVKSPYIGGGWYTTETPTVIKRNILENPAWYTSYTPYQAEISQGRLESLLNYQTMVSDLTALPISNASLLDEGSAAAEAMAMSLNSVPAARAKRPTKVFMVSEQVHPTTLDVLRTRAEGLGITIETKDLASPTILDTLKEVGDDLVGVMVQYPDTMGSVCDFRDLADAAHEQGVLLSVGTDLSALTVLTPPGEWGADIAFGNSQRFGVPLGYGGPHAAFMAVKDSLKRRMPGRLVGVSKDRLGRRALRLALQTREQHIRREKATSNVCTSQALLANMAAMYAVYHGPSRLRDMQLENIRFARMLQEAAAFYGIECISTSLDPRGRVSSDTVVLRFGTRYQCFGVFQELTKAGILPGLGEGTLTFAINGEFSPSKLFRIVRAFKQNCQNPEQERELDVTARIWTEGQKKTNEELLGSIPQALRRKSSFLTHPVFNSHHSETELLRYIHHLQSKDLSLVHSMIPLGSCTMKLNGSTQMELIGNTRLANAHPLAKLASQPGTQTLLRQLAGSLSNITGMDKTDLHPNSGAQGEYAGLRLIRKYHKHHQSQRDICLIPVSAHGTNPASAAMAGMRVVPLKCDTVTGNLDIEDLKAKCEKHKEELGAIMITYPSTFGVFEPNIKTVCDIVHEHGGLVYMDGANMNAQIGLTSPGSLGADVCHLNLHKTFCIPHGGGGPGVGPICMKDFLFEYSKVKSLDNGTTTSAPYGSAGILPISWAYIRMLGKFSHWFPMTTQSILIS